MPYLPAQLETAREAKQAAVLAKQQEEARVLAEIQARLDEEKAAAAARLEAAKAHAVLTKADNEARIRAKKEADAMQRRLDEEMMRAGIRWVKFHGTSAGGVLLVFALRTLASGKVCTSMRCLSVDIMDSVLV